MSDFSQNGVITTLHNLSHRPFADLEAELVKFSKERPIGLILPCLYSEIQTAAMPNIVSQLAKVKYIEEIIIGLDRATEEEYRHALEFFSQLPQRHRVLWNDGKRLRALDEELAKLNLSPGEAGKGRNVWYCMGYSLASNRTEAIALHDCDILTYDRELLARLIYPIANSNFNYAFCKGYYSRVSNGKMNGRVSRLLVTPLIKSLEIILGSMEYLQYLDSFNYPLAGEFSFRRDVINDLRIPSDWGLEIGVLSEMKRNYSANSICQVDIADNYDHKHQSLSLNNDDGGLSKMSIDISKAIFRKLATQGVVFDQATFRSLKATYYRKALDFIEIYRNDAEINGLSLDIHVEGQAVEMFAENILKAGMHFLENPMERPFIPRWSRVRCATTDFLTRFIDAVDADMKEFGPQSD